MQPEAIFSCPIDYDLRGETDTQLSSTSFQRVVEHEKVSPQAPLLQANEPQFPELFLTGPVIQTLLQLCCPSLDQFQYVSVCPPLRGPRANLGFQV